MKTIALVAVVAFLVLSGLALASQSGERKDRPSMMEEMMKGRKEGERMGGMMRMMKMMESMRSGSDQTKENQKQ